MIGTNNFDVLFPKNAIKKMINFFNTDCIYNLKYNNTELLKNTNIKRFFILDLLKNNNKSTTEITRVPDFVEELYITFLLFYV